MGVLVKFWGRKPLECMGISVVLIVLCRGVDLPVVSRTVQAALEHSDLTRINESVHLSTQAACCVC